MIQRKTIAQLEFEKEDLVDMCQRSPRKAERLYCAFFSISFCIFSKSFVINSKSVRGRFNSSFNALSLSVLYNTALRFVDTDVVNYDYSGGKSIEPPAIASNK
jgi:hypothetical protein